MYWFLDIVGKFVTAAFCMEQGFTSSFKGECLKNELKKLQFHEYEQKYSLRLDLDGTKFYRVFHATYETVPNLHFTNMKTW